MVEVEFGLNYVVVVYLWLYHWQIQLTTSPCPCPCPSREKKRENKEKIYHWPSPCYSPRRSNQALSVNPDIQDLTIVISALAWNYHVGYFKREACLWSTRPKGGDNPQVRVLLSGRDSSMHTGILYIEHCMDSWEVQDRDGKALFTSEMDSNLHHDISHVANVLTLSSHLAN